MGQVRKKNGVSIINEKKKKKISSESQKLRSPVFAFKFWLFNMGILSF